MSPSTPAEPAARVATPSATPTAVATAFASAPTLATDTDWPTFAHDLSRSSIQPASSALTPASVPGLQLLWTFKSAGGYDLGSPIVVAGVVYAADISGNVVALSEATGAVLWSHPFDAEMKMTPALYDGHLFVATFINKAQTESSLYALDPLTGAIQWQASLHGGVHGSPVAMNGRLFVPVSLGDPGFCNPGGVYEFVEATGVVGASWLVGGSVAANGGAIWSPITYDGSRMLYGTGNTCITTPQSGNAIVALSPGTMVADWELQTANPFTDDDVGGGVVEANDTAYVTGKNGNLYAVNPASGAVRWQKNLGVPDLYGSYSTPVVADNTLMTSVGYRYDPFNTQPAGTQFGELVGLNPSTGAQNWQIIAVSPFYQPPAVVGSLAFTTADATLEALNVTTGAVLWSDAIATDSRTEVVVANDSVFAADAAGNLYAYGLPTSANASMRQRTKALFKFEPQPPRFVNRIPRFCKLK